MYFCLPLFQVPLLCTFFLVVVKWNFMDMNLLNSAKTVLSLILSLHRDFPSTFRGIHGNITYTLTVTISRPWHLSKSYVTELMFMSRVNLNDPQLWVCDPRFFEPEVWFLPPDTLCPHMRTCMHKQFGSEENVTVIKQIWLYVHHHSYILLMFYFMCICIMFHFVSQCPLSGSNFTTLCCLWCASGPITLTATAEKKAFAPGIPSICPSINQSLS